MKMQTLIALVFLICLAHCLPTTFDFRVQPSMVKYADFSLKQEGTCVAHAWGLQLAQVVSNAASLTLKSKVRLSSQHLIECIKDDFNEICHDASLDNIHQAINYIQNSGITTEDCIKNKLFSNPRQFCPRECDDGYPFEYSFKAIITKHETFNETLNSLIKDERTTGFAIVRVYSSMNYYSSEHPDHLENTDGQSYEFRVGEIVGWRNKGDDLVVRLGLGQGWGYNGFANLNINKHKKLVAELYTVKIAETTKIQIPDIQLEQY